MNTRTTLYLAAALAGLAIIYFWAPRSHSAGTAPVSAASSPSSGVAQKIVESPQDKIVKIVCQRKGGKPWTFEKRESPGSDQKVWRMTAPVDQKVATWDVDRIARTLSSLQYEVSYQPGEPGAITAKKAGLDPPEATVTLSAEDGSSETVEIGGPASANSTYVRLAGSSKILVGTPSLANLIKSKAIDYRDLQLWTFSPSDAKRLELTDRSGGEGPVTYVFAREGAGWKMESPVAARATDKVDQLVQAMSRLRVMKWVDDRPDRLFAYGLKPAPVLVRLTVEEQVVDDHDKDETSSSEDKEAKDEKDNKTKPTKLTTYELRVSDQSPIGEDTKVYVRAGDDPMVATFMKTSADKFQPVMAEWRDMEVTPITVTHATKIEMRSPRGTTTWVKRDGGWFFDPNGGRAESTMIQTLLKEVDNLRAVVFLDHVSVSDAKYGLDKPRVDIRLTLPGVADVERITVGQYTDPTTRRMMYVRRNQAVSIAKVRTSSVSSLLQRPDAFRDRTIFRTAGNRLETIVLSAKHAWGGERTSLTFTKQNGSWSMTSPVVATLRQDRVTALADALGGLRAESIVAQRGEATAFGLQTPAVRVTFTYKPPVEYRIQAAGGNDSEETKSGKTKPTEQGSVGPEAESASGSKQSSSAAEAEEEEETAPENKKDKMVPVEVQPPSKTLALLATAHDGKYYAMRTDQPAVYEVSESFFKQLSAEYRTAEVFTFDDSKVTRFTVRSGDQTLAFDRADGKWAYHAEPDLPLDSKKIDNFLLQIKGLKTEHYAAYEVKDPAGYGLDAPSREVTVALEDGTSQSLLVSPMRCQGDSTLGYYALRKGHPQVFLLTAESAGRIAVSLDELEAKP